MANKDNVQMILANGRDIRRLCRFLWLATSRCTSVAISLHASAVSITIAAAILRRLI